MSATGKWVVGIIVVLAVLCIGYWYFTNQAKAPADGLSTTSPSGATATSDTLPTAANDTSAAALDKDTAAIDAQLSGLSSDAATANASLNDQPIQQ